MEVKVPVNVEVVVVELVVSVRLVVVIVMVVVVPRNPVARLTSLLESWTSSSVTRKHANRSGRTLLPARPRKTS